MLKILQLLIKHPCNYKQINEAFLADFYLQKKVSDDMICMYINTLREIGCDISRPSRSNDFCYVLSSHPFALKISSKESKTIEAILKSLVKSDDWRLLMEVCAFFTVLKEYCSVGSDLSFFRVLSPFLKIDSELLKQLSSYCEKEKSVVLEYSSPNSGTKEIALVLQRISLENSKLYVWGYNENLQECQYLRVDRIKKIKVISLAKSEKVHVDLMTVVYKLSNQNLPEFVPDEMQKILKVENGDIFIEEKIINKFAFMQKILYYAQDCVVLEPAQFRAEVILAINEVLKNYG